MRVLTVGAGIAGLAAAHAVRREAALRGIPLELQVLEASGRPGGRIHTTEEDGYLVEWAANGIQGHERSAAALLEDLGLAKERVPARPESARRYVYRNGRLHRHVSGGAAIGAWRPGDRYR